MKILKSIILFAGFSATLLFAEVNINTANVEELATLPGIGESKAKAIIEYREQNGSFKAVDDLVNVPGIGDKTVQGLEKEASVGGDKKKK